ncbi:MAG: tetratricopeptide repeat protein [Burkholderiales bacterium]
MSHSSESKMNVRLLILIMGTGWLPVLSGCASAPSAAQVQAANPAPPGYVWEPAGFGLYRTVPKSLTAAGADAMATDAARIATQFKLMEAYERGGIDGPPDLAQAAAVLLQIVAAGDAGDVLAERKLAIAYQLGIGLPHSEAEALSWWQAAAEHGDPTAEAAMMRFYTIGGDGLKPDWQKAEFWRKALQRSVPGLAAFKPPGSTAVQKGP